MAEQIAHEDGALRAKFTWDAENRLVGWEPLLFVSGTKKVDFGYDYLSRRNEKQVSTHNGSTWLLSERRRFFWSSATAGSGWLMLMETIESDTSSPPDGTLDATRVKKYTWGRDLSGMNASSCATGVSPLERLTGAGGIGGLLSVLDDTGTSGTTDDLYYVYMYDANGNVGQVIDLAASSASASIKAHYEYDAYGKVLVQSGSYAAANPYRFSTKPWDDETGLGYWGERHYDPRLGRWINHDPIGELGGDNLYGYVLNGPTGNVDPNGCFIWGCNSKPQIPTGPDPRTDGQCCADAKAAGLDKGDAGGVICCDGRKVACAWYTHTGNPQDDFVTNIFITCTTAHEKTHFDDVPDCPNLVPDLSRPPFKPGADPKKEECKGYKAALDCLKKNRGQCDKAPDPKACKDKVDNKIKWYEQKVKEYCGP